MKLQLKEEKNKSFFVHGIEFHAYPDSEKCVLDRIPFCSLVTAYWPYTGVKWVLYNDYVLGYIRIKLEKKSVLV